MKHLFIFYFLIFIIPVETFSQDLLTEEGYSGDISVYRKRINEKFPVGKVMKKTAGEADTTFANQLFVNGVELHHETITRVYLNTVITL